MIIRHFITRRVDFGHPLPNGNRVYGEVLVFDNSSSFSGWSNEDNLGAMIISPTRELALQTYEVLRKVGKRHDFSAGLIIGGKDLEDEQQRIQNTNIIIGTPGRILQHFDEVT